MRALENVATAHLILADSYRDLALRYLEDARTETPASSATRTTPGRQVRGSAEAAPRHHPGEVAAAFFQLSLDEYREALARDPTNTPALNQFARAFWQWRLAAADGVLSREPTLAHAREAEWNARRAVSIVEAKLGRASASLVLSDRSRDAQGKLAGAVPAHLHPPAATALGSLGAVLLAQARAARSPGGARLRPGARARAPDVRRRPLDARPRVAVRCVPGVPEPTFRGGPAGRAGARRSRRRPRRGSRTSAPCARRRPSPWTACGSASAREKGGPLPVARTSTTSLEVCRQDWLGLASEREGQIRYALRRGGAPRAATICADAWACGCRSSPVRRRPCTFASGEVAWSASVSRRRRRPSSGARMSSRWPRRRAGSTTSSSSRARTVGRCRCP